MASAYVLGIDLGTSGARALVVDRQGAIVAQAFAPLPAPAVVGAGGREQDANLWWQAAASAVREALARLSAAGGQPRDVGAACVDATSGTIVPVDARCAPLGPGLMYNDGRAGAQARDLNAAARAHGEGEGCNASYASAKILWLREHAPAIGIAAARFLHQTDFVNARLLGATHAVDVATDESSALKTGYDIVARRWAGSLAVAGIDVGQLPPVVPGGSTLGAIGAAFAADTGLPPDCRVVAGMTDGTAAAVASGAAAIGDGNTTIGTTLVWKLVAAGPVVDPQGRLYCHRHPGGAFLPGGAGNAGGEGIAHQVLGGDPAPGAALDRLAAALADAPPRDCSPIRCRAPVSASPSSTRASPVSPIRARAPGSSATARRSKASPASSAGATRSLPGSARRPTAPSGRPASARATRAGCSCAPTSSAARCAAPCTPNPASAPRWSRR
ncbi:MAG: hypothetical protein IPI40_04455 [Betaproteobacteria bacterium]|nr:hypothetical protein [Betaproteobacteria bacterium]